MNKEKLNLEKLIDSIPFYRVEADKEWCVTPRFEKIAFQDSGSYQTLPPEPLKRAREKIEKKEEYGQIQKLFFTNPESVEDKKEFFESHKETYEAMIRTYKALKSVPFFEKVSNWDGAVDIVLESPYDDLFNMLPEVTGGEVLPEDVDEIIEKLLNPCSMLEETEIEHEQADLDTQNVEPLEVIEKEYDFDDFDNREPEKFLSKVIVEKCPFCGQRRYRVLDRIPAKFLHSFNHPRLTLLTAKIVASPRHSDSIVALSREATHSDNNYQGWAGDHDERVRVLTGKEAEGTRSFQEYKNLKARAVDTRGQFFYTSPDLKSPPDEATKKSPHLSCLPQEKKNNGDKVATQEELEIYAIDEPEFVYLQTPPFVFFNHLVSNGEAGNLEQAKVLPFGRQKATFVESESEIEIQTSDYESVNLDAGRYMLLHPIEECEN